MLITPVLTKLDAANTAYLRGEYTTAIGLCEEALPVLAKGIGSEDNSAPERLDQTLQYIDGNLLYGMALWQSGQSATAETVYLRAMELVTPLIDNSCHPIRYRARLVTGYKRLFLAISVLYESSGTPERLRRYVTEHQPMLTRWALSLQALNYSESASN